MNESIAQAKFTIGVAAVLLLFCSAVVSIGLFLSTLDKQAIIYLKSGYFVLCAAVLWSFKDTRMNEDATINAIFCFVMVSALLSMIYIPLTFIL